MKLIKLYITICLLISPPAFSQESAQNLIIGNFASANSFSISPNGYLFISDSGSNEIIKLDTLGNEIKRIGGYGWDESAFDNPADIFATTLNVYVSDKNNNRIQIFDKDLNYLFSFTTRGYENRDYQFGYPEGCVVSGQGDFFILDSDNNRVLKYNLNGDFLMQIGSYDSGDYMLSNPQNIAISSDGKLFVTDDEGIKIFDYYGNGILKLKPDFRPENINITFDHLTINDRAAIKYLNLRNSSTGFQNCSVRTDLNESEIREVLIYNSKIYILLDDKIIVEKI